jgi:hypothetical protein
MSLSFTLPDAWRPGGSAPRAGGGKVRDRDVTSTSQRYRANSLTLDRGERVGRLVRRPEEAERGARRQVGRRAGVLDDARPAARQVADRPVAQPPRTRAHVGRLRAAQLAARSLHVGAERVGGPRDDRGVGEPPAVGGEQRAVLGLARMDVRRQLERRPRPPRQVDDLHEPGPLVAVEHLAVEDHAAARALHDDARARSPGAIRRAYFFA